jgi:hypothetical protein
MPKSPPVLPLGFLAATTHYDPKSDAGMERNHHVEGKKLMGKGKPTFSSFCFTVPRLEAQ